MAQILSRDALARAVAAERSAGKRIVFTNGCFDLLHAGHARYLREARTLGDVLVVGLNSDASVRRLGKGAERPLQVESDRAELLAALAMVDYVSIFDEDTPLELVRSVLPDVLAKGGDWSEDQVVGGDVVKARGGKVAILPYHPGASTTELVRKIRRV